MRVIGKGVAAGIAAAAGVVLMAATPASAHVHEVGDQVIANGQHHPVFTRVAGTDQGTACDTSAGPGGAPIGPAWYGLETAHHGPDTGTAGKGDGCYQTAVSATGRVVPINDTNPAID